MKILYVSSYYCHGDTISINGMINFFTYYYDKVFVLCHWNFISTLRNFYRTNSKVIPISYDYFMGNDWKETHKDDKVDYLNLYDGDFYDRYSNKTCVIRDGFVYDDCNVTPFDFLSKGISENVYDKYNLIGKKFGFDIPREKGLDLTSDFYNRSGLPTEMKYLNFNFDRMIDDEDELFERLDLPSEYGVICDGNHMVKTKDNDYGLRHIGDWKQSNYIPIKTDYIKSDRVVNLHLLSQKYFDIVKVVENASEINLIENSISLLIYYLQLTGRMKRVPITFHTYVRQEEDRKDFVNMFLNPKLENWTFV